MVKMRLHAPTGDASRLAAFSPLVKCLDILGRVEAALPAGRLAGLGATTHFHHGAPPLFWRTL